MCVCVVFIGTNKNDYGSYDVVISVHKLIVILHVLSLPEVVLHSNFQIVVLTPKIVVKILG